MSAFFSSHRSPTDRHRRAVGHGHSAQRSRARQSHETAEGRLPSLPVALITTLSLALGGGAALLLVAAGLLVSANDPDAMIAPVALGILGVMSLLAGFVAARLRRDQPCLFGMAVGLCLTLLLWILTAVIDRSDPTLTLGVPLWGRIALHAGVVALSCAGSLMGCHKRPKAHHRKR